MDRIINLDEMNRTDLIRDATHETLLDTCRLLAPTATYEELTDWIEILKMKLYYMPIDVPKYILKKFRFAFAVIEKERGKLRRIPAM